MGTTTIARGTPLSRRERKKPEESPGLFIAFRRRSGIIGGLIGLLDGRGPYCHAEIFFRKTRPPVGVVRASDSRDIAFGCHAWFGAGFYEPNYGPDEWDVVSVPWNIGEAMASCLSVNGDHYDYLGVFNFVLRKLTRGKFQLSRAKGRWFCSADVSLVGLAAGGRTDLSKEEAIGPNELASRIEGTPIFGKPRREWRNYVTKRSNP